ncbi:unnamed protein product [Somion occarium]|uniref:Uncharacterized protein n=1 Tax=Somion occarium TaxID=3059160 RepID=A0ABP1CTN5_9APHY
MPGPRNAKKQKKLQSKKEKKSKTARQVSSPPLSAHSLPVSSSVECQRHEQLAFVESVAPSLHISTPSHPLTPPCLIYTQARTPEPLYHDFHDDDYYDVNATDDEYYSYGYSLPKEPFIQDPGNGPRVKDINAFLASSFATPPSLDDPLCAEFAQEDLIDMLCNVLPEETALILWYNKSRLNARICPACQRLYRLGDILPEHIPTGEDESPPGTQPMSQSLYREQSISGICSPMCFILAAFHYPAAISSTFGRMAEELSDETWALLDSPSSRPTNDMGLGMLLKMTRCHDLGLGQLLFPELASEDDESPSECGSDCWSYTDNSLEEEEQRGRKLTRD